MAAVGHLVATRERAVPGPVIAGLTLIACAVAMLGATLETLARPTVGVVWGSIALAAYLAGLLCIVGARYDGLGITEWKTGPWMLTWYGIAFGLVTVTWSRPQYGTLSEVALPSMLSALWLVAVAMSVWTVGYQVGPGRLVSARAALGMARLGRRLGPAVRPAAPWILYGVGTCSRLATVATSGQLGYVGSSSAPAGGYTEFLSALSFCAPLAVAAASLQTFREGRRGSGKTLAVLFAAEAVVGAASGGKESFVFAVLAAAIPFTAARRKLPKKTLAVLVLFFLVVVIPFNQAYRASVRQGPQLNLTPREALDAAPGILQGTLASKNPVTLLGGSVAYLGQRVSEISSPAVVLQRVPAQVPFASPAQLVTGPALGLAPRALWHGKPTMAGGQFSQLFFGTAPTTATPDTMPGGLYWHGGWVPLIVCMFLLGCGVRLMDGALDVRTNPHAVFLLLLLFEPLVGAEGDWNSVLASIPATMFAWLVACFLAFRRQSPSPASTGHAHMD
jgi:hypothetical protein